MLTLSGTTVLIKPGIIGGGNVSHDCPLSRSVGYFLEPLLLITPFAKKPSEVTLRGITSDDNDLSVRRQIPWICHTNPELLNQVDLIRTVSLPHLQLFGVSDGLELRVNIVTLAVSISH